MHEERRPKGKLLQMKREGRAWPTIARYDGDAGAPPSLIVLQGGLETQRPSPKAAAPLELWLGPGPGAA